MNPSTLSLTDPLTAFRLATCLQRQALELLNVLGERAETGDKKAQRLENLAWYRYNRRTGLVNYAADLHWGSL